MELEILDRQLKAFRPVFYDKLQSPLDLAAIHELEKQYNLVLPEDLKRLYGWKNGQDVNATDAFVNNSMFLPLGDALEIAQELTSMIGEDFEIENWWNKNWIPLFHNGGGDYICCDLEGTFTGRAGQLVNFWHADPDREVIAPALSSFVTAINQYYEQVPAVDYDEYFEIEALEGYPLKFVVKHLL